MANTHKGMLSAANISLTWALFTVLIQGPHYLLPNIISCGPETSDMPKHTQQLPSLLWKTMPKVNIMFVMEPSLVSAASVPVCE